METKSRQLWLRILEWVLPASSAVVGLFWIFRIPSPGEAGTLLALGATLMPLFWEDANKVSRAIWVGMLFVLFFVEYRAIAKDRAEFAAKQEQTQNEQMLQFANLLGSERKGFAGLSEQNTKQFTNTLKQMLAQDSNERRQFAALLARQQDLLQKQQAMADIEKSMLVEERGGDGYPWIVAIPPSSAAYPPEFDGSGKWALFVQNSGTTPLMNVMLEIQECGSIYRKRTVIQLGMVRSSQYGSYPINYGAKPGCYIIIITTRVTRYTEYMILYSLEANKWDYEVFNAENKRIVGTKYILNPH